MKLNFEDKNKQKNSVKRSLLFVICLLESVEAQLSYNVLYKYMLLLCMCTVMLTLNIKPVFSI